jgi:peroxiredoxin
MLQPGDEAPDFELSGSSGDDPGPYRLSDHLDDGPVVLAFYPQDFSPVCTEELCTLHEGDFFQFVPGVDLFGISTDGVYSHKEFANKHGFDFPLLSDHDGEVASSYGVRYEEGLEFGGADVGRVTKRSLFVVDTDRRVRYAWSTEDPETLPDLLEAKDALDDIADAGDEGTPA